MGAWKHEQPKIKNSGWQGKFARLWLGNHWEYRKIYVCSGDVRTILWLHFDGTNGSRTFIDECGHMLTTYGGVQISTEQSLSGGASGLFDGSTGYLSVPDSNDFDLSNEDFKIEVHVRFNSLSFVWQYIIGKRYDYMNSNADFSYGLGVSYAPPFNNIYYLAFEWTTDGFTRHTVLSEYPFTLNTWYNLAVIRNGENLDMYVNNMKIGTHNIGHDIIHKSVESLLIGAAKYTDTKVYGGSPHSFFNGYMDELLISKGT